MELRLSKSPPNSLIHPTISHRYESRKMASDTTTDLAKVTAGEGEITKESVVNSFENQLPNDEDDSFEEDSEDEPPFPFDYRGAQVLNAAGGNTSKTSIRPTPRVDASKTKSSDNKKPVKKEDTKGKGDRK